MDDRSTPPRSIDLHIGELILHGFRPGDRDAIARAVERELSRLFSAGGLPPTLLDRAPSEGSLEVHRLDGGSFDVPRGASPDAVGVQVARAIHRGLGGVPEPARPAAQGSEGPGGSQPAGRGAQR